MKITVLIVFAVALLGGCAERVSSPASEVRAPEFAPPVAQRKAAIASATTQVAPIDEPARHSVPDFKDSAGSLDSSK
jgi:hypothetical protein